MSVESSTTLESVQETPFRASRQPWVATPIWWGSTKCWSWRNSQNKHTKI